MLFVSVHIHYKTQKLWPVMKGKQNDQNFVDSDRAWSPAHSVKIKKNITAEHKTMYRGCYVNMRRDKETETRGRLGVGGVSACRHERQWYHLVTDPTPFLNACMVVGLLRGWWVQVSCFPVQQVCACMFEWWFSFFMCWVFWVQMPSLSFYVLTGVITFFFFSLRMTFSIWSVMHSVCTYQVCWRTV